MKRKKKEKPQKETKEERIQKLKDEIKKFNFGYSIQEFDLVKNKQICEEVTTGACWRPDIFLDNDNSCNLCPIKEHCACKLKNIVTKKSKK
jgi:hypothetical protein